MKRLSKGVSLMMVVLTLAMAMPRPVLAGDEEWATAGKILTGLFVFGAVAKAVQPPPVSEPQTVYVERPVYVDRPVYVERQQYLQQPVYTAPPPEPPAQAVPPPPAQEQPIVVYQDVQYVEPPVVTYEVRYFEGKRMENCPRVNFRGPTTPREIVLPYGYGRRLYQPGIRGHLAYIQEWSQPRGTWVSIGYHPSMWR